MKKILMITTDWAVNEYRIKNNAYGGVSYYRIVKPAQYLRRWFDVDIMGKEIKDESEGKDEIQYMYNLVSKYDMVITKQVDSPQTCANVLFCCQRLGVPLVVDLDDNYYDIREDQPGYKYYHKGSQSRAVFSAYLSLADAVFVSTEPLKKKYTEALKEIYGIEKDISVLPNSFDFDDFNYPRGKSDKLVIGYTGSITHNTDLDIVLPAIREVMKRNKNVEFHVLGAITTQYALNVFSEWDDDEKNRVLLFGGSEAFDKYPELLMSQKFDIGIAPLFDDEFNRGKSHIKWMEYTAMGIPTIASPTYPYKDKILGKNVIKHGKTGLFANTKDEWISELQKLIDNEELRGVLAKNAQKQIEKEWLYKDNIKLWKNAIEKVKEIMV